MATTIALRKILDRKTWEICGPAPFVTSDVVMAASTQFDQLLLLMYGVSNIWVYDPREDSYLPLPNSGMTTWTASQNNIVYHPNGPTGTASAGAASTLTSVLTTVGQLAGYTIRITAGTGAGQDRVIASNTVGTNAVFTVTAPWTTNPDNTSVYLILSGRFWCLNGSATVGMSYYDVATNAWVSRSVTSMAGSSGFVATPAFGNTIASGTATSGSATTLANTGKAWATNQWANSQVRITAGTGAGKVAVITSNTATTLTFPTVTTVLDNTSQYVIEPDDNAFYAFSGIITYKYSISGNSWTTVTPGVARTTALSAAGGAAHFVGVTSDTTWADETNIKNGRYIYSFAGSNSANLAIYDIAAVTWINTQTSYQRSTTSNSTGSLVAALATGASTCYDGKDYLYIMPPISNVPPYFAFKFNIPTNTLEPWTAFIMTGGNGSGSAGYKLVPVSYTDGGTIIRYIYFQQFASPNTMYRQMII